MNATELSLKGAMVVRNDEDQISYAWLDTLAPQSLTEVEFKPATAEGLLENWNRRPESTMPDQLVEGQITDTLWVWAVCCKICLTARHSCRDNRV